MAEWLVDNTRSGHVLGVLIVIHAMHFAIEGYVAWTCYKFSQRDKSRHELIEALETSFLRKDADRCEKSDGSR